MSIKMIKGLDYYSIRIQLFFNSYIANKLAINSRVKLRINKPFTDEKALYDWNGKNHLDLAQEFADTWKSIYKENVSLDPHVFTMTNWFILSKLLGDEVRLATKLNILPELLVDFIVFDRKPKGLIAERNFIVASPISPLTQGTYIPIRINTSKEDVIKALIDAQEFLSDFYPDKSVGRILKRTRRDISPQDQSKIGVYLMVEKSFMEFDDDRARDEYDTFVSAAIEHLAGSMLEEKFAEIPDEELDEIYKTQTKPLIKRLTRDYYDVIERYQLPTPKYWSSILRLITD